MSPTPLYVVCCCLQHLSCCLNCLERTRRYKSYVIMAVCWWCVLFFLLHYPVVGTRKKLWYVLHTHTHTGITWANSYSYSSEQAVISFAFESCCSRDSCCHIKIENPKLSAIVPDCSVSWCMVLCEWPLYLSVSLSISLSKGSSDHIFVILRIVPVHMQWYLSHTL